MASDEDEIAALDRVLTRTVLTKDEDLQQVLSSTPSTTSLVLLSTRLILAAF